MGREVPEADRKEFRKLREVALEKLSGQILDDVVRVCTDRSVSAHHRYLEVWRLLRNRDRDMAEAFDYISRSRMIQHLAAMRALGLLAVDDVERMSHDTQERVRLLMELRPESEE